MDMHTFYKIKVGDYVKCYDNIGFYKVKSVTYRKQYTWTPKTQMVELGLDLRAGLSGPLVVVTDISCIL